MLRKWLINMATADNKASILIKLFPQATIFEEKFLGLTKSFVAYENP
jgi:hypothetical protein